MGSTFLLIFMIPMELRFLETDTKTSYRIVFRNLSNIEDGALYEIVNVIQPLSAFAKSFILDV